MTDTTTKLYMLSYDTDSGSREEWNIFYTPVEVYSSEKLREDRINVLKQELDDEDEPMGYEFHKTETELDKVQDAQS